MTASRLIKCLCLATTALQVLAVAPASAASPRTPIQHVIIIVGENHSFDNVFGTYRRNLVRESTTS
jgi:phospholipase C